MILDLTKGNILINSDGNDLLIITKLNYAYVLDLGKMNPIFPLQEVENIRKTVIDKEGTYWLPGEIAYKLVVNKNNINLEKI